VIQGKDDSSGKPNLVNWSGASTELHSIIRRFQDFLMSHTPNFFQKIIAFYRDPGYFRQVLHIAVPIATQ